MENSGFPLAMPQQIIKQVLNRSFIFVFSLQSAAGASVTSVTSVTRETRKTRFSIYYYLYFSILLWYLIVTPVTTWLNPSIHQCFSCDEERKNHRHTSYTFVNVLLIIYIISLKIISLIYRITKRLIHKLVMPACPASYALRSGEVTACGIWKPQAMKQQYPFITPSIPKKSWPFSVNFWEKTFEKNIGKNYAKRLTLMN